MVKIVPPWLTLVASFLETPHLLCVAFCQILIIADFLHFLFLQCSVNMANISFRLTLSPLHYESKQPVLSSQ